MTKVAYKNTKYSVCSDGFVYGKDGFKLSPGKGKNGYERVSLYLDGKTKNFLVHRLVAECFLPNSDSKTCVNHINNNRSDNRVSNLEWATYKENSEHSVKQSRHRHGEGISYGKMDELQALSVITMKIANKPIWQFRGYAGVCFDNLYKIQKRETWKHLWKIVLSN